MERTSDFVDEGYVYNDLSILEKLTLVIPTYNRNYYLSRCLWYHAHFPFGQIIVADSSPEEKKRVNRDTVSKIREKFGTNILYLEYEPETEIYGGDIYRKWGDAIQHVTTPYSQIVTDKEFAVPLGLVDAVQYLENHLDYCAADGRNYFLNKSNNKNGQSYILLQRRTDRHSEDDDDALKRFTNSFMITTPMANCLIPSIMRSHVRKEVSSYLSEDGVNDIRLGEYLQAYFGHLQGKYYYNESRISLIRDTSIITSNGRKKLFNSPESSTTRYPTVEDLIVTNKNEFFGAFRTALKTHLEKYTPLSDKEADIFVEKNFPNDYFIRYYLEKRTIITKAYDAFPFVVNIWNILPFWFRKSFSKVSLYLFNKSIPIGPLQSIMNSDDIELIIIKKIVDQTIHLHESDKPVIY